MDVKPKDTEAAAKRKKDLAKREKMIARQWEAFSQTEAFADFMQYGKTTSEMLTTYAKEGVMPSPIKEGEQLILTNEKALNLLQNARGCDIVISYVEGYLPEA